MAKIGLPYGQQAIELYRLHKPDITMIDLRMPILGGVEAIAAIRREFPDARIIVLTTYDGDEDIYRSLQAGAQGYLLKDMFFEELEDAIRKVHAGSRRIPTHVAERLAERVGLDEEVVARLQRHVREGDADPGRVDRVVVLQRPAIQAHHGRPGLLRPGSSLALTPFGGHSG